MGSMLRNAVLVALLMAAPIAPAGASDQRTALELVQSGAIMSLRDILNIVQPQVAGTLVGADLDVNTLIYRLRFMNNGNVVNVDVDARTGQRLSRRHY